MVTHKIFSTIAILFFLSVSILADPILVANWNWTDQDGIVHEYEAYQFLFETWDASNDAVADGWHLATITSEEEQNALITGLQEVSGEYWLGAYQANLGEDPENNWMWVTGETWYYKNWAPGEPNDAHGINSEQHLATWSNWGTHNWLWNDEGYLPNMTGFVAESSHSVPEPGSLSLLTIGLFSLLGFTRKRKQ